MKIENLKLKSPAFPNRGKIPDKYGFTAENVNPPLKIENVPPDTESLALIMDDPDAFKEQERAWDNWIVWNIDPETREIPENSIPENARVGKNDFGERNYGGPNPPDEVHTYRFRLFALDKELDLPESAGRKEVEAAMKNHIVDQTQLLGKYAPWQPSR